MHERGDDGVENCYVIKDRLNSVTVDGYSVLSETVTTGLGGEVMAEFSGSNVFGNATCIRFTDDFSSDGNGNYVKKVDGRDRLVSPLLVSHDSAEAWAGGRAVARASEEPFVLMAMAVQECDNGEQACLVASSSTDFASSDSMSSAVLGNSRTLTGIFRYMGRDNAPVELVFKPFGSTEIESLATHDANVITIVLAVVPAVVVSALGLFVLIRRKNS